MLIVCPSCATSYMIDPAALGPAGRTVRCARCKATWFAGGAHNVTAIATGPKIEIAAEPEVDAFVDGVIAEAEAEAAGHGEPAGDAGAPPPDEMQVPAPAAPRMPRGESFMSPAVEHEPPGTIDDAPPLVPPIEQEMPEPELPAPPEPEETESFAARRLRMQSRRKKARRSSRWTAVLLLLFAFNVALLGARNEVVRYLPQTAPLFAAIGLPVNLRHLEFQHVRISRETASGATFLVVQGSIVSTAHKPIAVPRLRFAVRNKAGQEIYTWTMEPDRKVLGPGERLDFRSQLASPPKDAHDVMVRFFTANDAMAGDK